MEPYAVIEKGGKQYLVKTGETLQVELVDAAVGARVNADRVLAVSDGNTLSVGAPEVAGAKVELEVLREFRGKKVVAFKRKRRKGYKKLIGHRQSLNEVKVAAITAG
jgi:large subunit ribosomal protein L21